MLDSPSEEQPPSVPDSRRQATFRLLLTVIAVAAMSVAAWRFIAAPSLDEAVFQGGIAFVVGFLALSPNFPSQKRGEKNSVQERPILHQETPRVPTCWLPVGLGIAALTAVTAASADPFAGLAQALGAHGQFALWCAGIALVAWGLNGAPRFHRPTIQRRETAALLAILLVALVLRLWGLDQLRVLVDEIHVATGVTYFWDTPQPQLLRPIGALDPFPRVFTYAVAQSVALFGRTFAALRVVPALIGTATVGALYLLTRELIDRRAALAAAALLATFPPFLHFSRIAVINIADPLVGTLMLAFLARALRDGRRSDYVLAGTLLGLTRYFHEAGRLLFPVLALLWISSRALTRTNVRHIEGTIYGFRARWPFSWRTLAVGLLAMLIVMAPLVIIEKTQPEQFLSRLKSSAQPKEYWEAVLLTSDLRPQLDLIRESALVFVRTPDSSLFFGGLMPLVLPMFVPLLLLGAAYALRQRTARLALLWIGLTIVGNSLLEDGQISVRFLAAFPAVALLMALGVTETARRLAGPRRAGILAAAVVIAVSAANGFAYFGPHLSYFNRQVRETGAPDGYDALLRAADLPPYSVVHLISSKPPFSQQYAEQLIRYLTDGVIIRVTEPEQVTADYLTHLARSAPQVFFVEAGAHEIAARIRQAFPTATGPQASPFDVPGPTFLMIRYAPPGSSATRSSP